MTSLVQKSQMVGEAVAKNAEGASRIKQKTTLISNHVDDANRIMRRMCRPCPAPHHPALPHHRLQAESAVFGARARCRRLHGALRRHPQPPPLPSPPLLLTLQLQVLMCTCAYIISKRI